MTVGSSKASDMEEEQYDDEIGTFDLDFESDNDYIMNECDEDDTFLLDEM